MPLPLLLRVWLALAGRRPRRRERAIRRSLRGKPRNGDANGALIGRPDTPRPRGPLVWLNAGTGTEPAALAELFRRLLQERPEVSVLLTVDPAEGPQSGSSDQAPPRRGVLRHPSPIDTPRAAAAFLDHWKPDVAIRTGLGLDPATMATIAARNVPLLLIDLHLPASKSRMFWKVPGLARLVLRPVHRLLVADEPTAHFLRRHGAIPERIEVLGHLPDATGALPCNDAERATLAGRIGARPVWLALAPSAAEVPIVLAAHRQAMRRAHRLLLILAPAVSDEVHGGPEAIAALAETEGLAVSRRWADEDPDLATEVWVADGLEERALWYRLAPVTFLGQTIEPRATDPGGALPGVSPYEPAALGSAILHGPVTGGYAEAYGKLLRAGATLPVRSAVELGQAVEMLQAPDRTAALAHAAWDVASSGAEVTDRVLDLVFGLIDAREVAG
jgi:3-deoxy-D-manno-octulosonic-acid transferase